MWKYSPIIFLFGCPVEPTDVQDVQEQQLPQQGNNMPPANGGQVPNGQGNAQGQAGQNMGDQNMGGQNMGGDQNMGGQNMGGDQGNLEGGMMNDANGGGGMPQNMMQSGDGSPPPMQVRAKMFFPSTRILLLLNSSSRQEIPLKSPSPSKVQLPMIWNSSSPKRALDASHQRSCTSKNPPKKPLPSKPQATFPILCG